MLDGWDVRGEIICPSCGVCIRGSLYYGSSFLAAAGGFSFLSLAIWAFLFLPWIRIGSVLFSFCADGYQETWIQWNGLSFRSVLLFFFFTDSSIPRGTGLFLVLIGGLCFEFGSFFFLSESEHCYYPLPRACTSPLL